MTQPGTTEVFHKRLNETRSGFPLRLIARAMNTHPSLDKWTGQPWPDGALMITTIALLYAALVIGTIAGLFWCEGTQPEGSPQPVAHLIDDSFRSRSLINLQGQSADC